MFPVILSIAWTQRGCDDFMPFHNFLNLANPYHQRGNCFWASFHRQRARGYPFQPNPLPFIVSPQYFVLLLCIFLLEILAGVLAYIYYQQLNEELKQNLRETMVQKYRQPEQEHVTKAVDKLQHEFKCCGSNSSSDWGESVWIRTSEADGRLVPDSCCKTQTLGCGRRDHPSNIYKGGCITKLENFILDHLKIIGAVGVGIACVQVSKNKPFHCLQYKDNPRWPP
uniref:CD151 molecule (Raph blood group) n=1 Tax=Hucho hucho TaxID=62062 RepID=A0A4W5KAY1_9TELE